MGFQDLRFDVNLSILFTELPLLERPAAAAAAGFDAVELWWPWAARPLSPRRRRRPVLSRRAPPPGLAHVRATDAGYGRRVEEAVREARRVGRPGPPPVHAAPRSPADDGTQRTRPHTDRTQAIRGFVRGIGQFPPHSMAHRGAWARTSPSLHEPLAGASDA
ncbi:hypothetical protein CD790_07065 [Streptomyces sp. SAJ15]|nr:hypothetical protein CD790_07065 [Streptomyces sp. SAJ15]